MNDFAYSPSLLAEDERIDEVNEHIRLIQKKKGLTFGTDAFLLAAYIKGGSRAHALELGGGTGIVSLLLASRKKAASITVAEIQPQFVDLIERNAEINGLSHVIRPMCVDVRELNAAKIGREVDLVLSNPPYMKCNAGKRNEEDEKYIARHEVCGEIGDFCRAAYRTLRHGGRFVCVWRPDRLTDLIYELRAARLEPKRMTFVHADETAEPCMVLVESVKGGASTVRVTPPLFLYEARREGEKSRTLTSAARMIYDNCCFPHETQKNGKQ